MKRAWFKIIKPLMAYQRSDRNGILILSAILILSILANYLVRIWEPGNSQDFSEIVELIDNWENSLDEDAQGGESCFYVFDPNSVSLSELDSFSLPSFVKRNIVSYRKAGGKFNSVQDIRKIYGMNDSLFNLIKPYMIVTTKQLSDDVAKKVSNVEGKEILPTGVFDPNTASKTELKSFGFTNFQINNIIKYREQGGMFNSKQDMNKIYGIDSLFFLGIEKFIEIQERAVLIDKHESVLKIIELNSADTTDLMSLPGIGKVFAQRIMKYRDLLGGYYTKEQLLEVYNFKEETYSGIAEMIMVDTLLLKKLRINFLDFKGLIKHPYLEKDQVQALLKQRNDLGPYNSLSELENNKAFDQEVFARISPYLTCR